jgi:hypothetical protein
MDSPIIDGPRARRSVLLRPSSAASPSRAARPQAPSLAHSGARLPDVRAGIWRSARKHLISPGYDRRCGAACRLPPVPPSGCPLRPVSIRSHQVHCLMASRGRGVRACSVAPSIAALVPSVWHSSRCRARCSRCSSLGPRGFCTWPRRRISTRPGRRAAAKEVLGPLRAGLARPHRSEDSLPSAAGLTPVPDRRLKTCRRRLEARAGGRPPPFCQLVVRGRRRSTAYSTRPRRVPGARPRDVPGARSRCGPFRRDPIHGRGDLLPGLPLSPPLCRLRALPLRAPEITAG